jgi:hypothetical protein
MLYMDPWHSMTQPSGTTTDVTVCICDPPHGGLDVPVSVVLYFSTPSVPLMGRMVRTPSVIDQSILEPFSVYCVAHA